VQQSPVKSELLNKQLEQLRRENARLRKKDEQAKPALSLFVLLNNSEREALSARAQRKKNAADIPTTSQTKGREIDVQESTAPSVNPTPPRLQFPSLRRRPLPRPGMEAHSICKNVINRRTGDKSRRLKAAQQTRTGFRNQWRPNPELATTRL
jgi:hypothetical protein